MSKAKKIAYWVATLWLALGMVSTGVVQLMQHPEEVEKMAGLGYPAYLLPLLGTWKLLGTAAILLPGFALLKEWAYAGFFFAMSGAIFSWVASGNHLSEALPALLLLVLNILSWFLRPPIRRLYPLHSTTPSYEKETLAHAG